MKNWTNTRQFLPWILLPLFPHWLVWFHNRRMSALRRDKCCRILPAFSFWEIAGHCCLHGSPRCPDPPHTTGSSTCCCLATLQGGRIIRRRQRRPGPTQSQPTAWAAMKTISPNLSGLIWSGPALCPGWGWEHEADRQRCSCSSDLTKTLLCWPS